MSMIWRKSQKASSSDVIKMSTAPKIQNETSCRFFFLLNMFVEKKWMEAYMISLDQLWQYRAHLSPIYLAVTSCWTSWLITS